MKKIVQKMKDESRWGITTSFLNNNRYGNDTRDYIRSRTPAPRKRKRRRAKGKKSPQSEKRSRTVGYVPPAGKVTNNGNKRWGDYSKVVYLQERGKLKQLPVCHHFFDPNEFAKKNRIEERMKRVEPYNFETTRHLYDPRPEKGVLSKRNKDRQFTKMFPKASTSKTNDGHYGTPIKHTGRVKPRKFGKRARAQDEVYHTHLKAGDASIPLKIRTTADKTRSTKKSKGDRFSGKGHGRRQRAVSNRYRGVEVTDFQVKGKRSVSPYHNRFQPAVRNQRKASRSPRKVR